VTSDKVGCAARVAAPQDRPGVASTRASSRAPCEHSAITFGAHGESTQGAAIAAAVLPAIRGLDDERARFYGDLVLHSLNEAARRALEAMMKGYEYKSDLAKKYVAQGEANARARDVLTVLRVRGIAVPETARECILAEKDPARLERWIERAIVAASVGELLDEPS
jgi:ADP-ribosylglycohydrolase